VRDEGGPNAAAEHSVHTRRFVQSMGKQRDELDGKRRVIHLGIQPERGVSPIADLALGQVPVERGHVAPNPPTRTAPMRYKPGLNGLAIYIWQPPLPSLLFFSWWEECGFVLVFFFLRMHYRCSVKCVLERCHLSSQKTNMI
jgi:hypothetical protein